MIIKRQIAFFLLFSAAMLMILNVILPHHHHEEEVCFIADHCIDDEVDFHADKHDNNGSEHEHHDGEADYCQLNDLYLAPHSLNPSWKTKNFLIENLQTVGAIIDIYCFVSDNSDYSPENRFIPEKKTLTIQSLTRALRAPPVC